MAFAVHHRNAVEIVGLEQVLDLAQFDLRTDGDGIGGHGVADFVFQEFVHRGMVRRRMVGEIALARVRG